MNVSLFFFDVYHHDDEILIELFRETYEVSLIVGFLFLLQHFLLLTLSFLFLVNFDLNTSHSCLTFPEVDIDPRSKLFEEFNSLQKENFSKATDI